MGNKLVSFSILGLIFAVLMFGFLKIAADITAPRAVSLPAFTAASVDVPVMMEGFKSQ